MPNELIRGSYGAYNLDSDSEDATTDLAALDARVDALEADTSLDFSQLVGSSQQIIYYGTGGSDVTGDGTSFATRFATHTAAANAIKLLGNTTGAVVLRGTGNGSIYAGGAFTWTPPSGYTPPNTASVASRTPAIIWDVYGTSGNERTTSDERFITVSGGAALDPTGASVTAGHPVYTGLSGLTTNAWKHKILRVFRSGVEVFRCRIAKNDTTTITGTQSTNDSSFTPAGTDTLYVADSAVSFSTFNIVGACASPIALIGIDVSSTTLNTVMQFDCPLLHLIGCRFGSTSAGITGLTVEGSIKIAADPFTDATLWTGQGYSSSEVALWTNWGVAISGASGNNALLIGQVGRTVATTFSQALPFLSDGQINVYAGGYLAAGYGEWCLNRAIIVNAGATYDALAQATGASGRGNVAEQSGTAALLLVNGDGAVVASVTGLTNQNWYLQGTWAGPVVDVFGGRVDTPLRCSAAAAPTVSTGVAFRVRAGGDLRVRNSDNALGATSNKDIQIGADTTLQVAYGSIPTAATGAISDGETASVVRL